MFLQENKLRNFVLVCLGQYCTKQLPVQGRNGHKRCSVKKGFLKNSAIFIKKHLCWNFFLIKLRAFRAATLLKKLHHRCFQVKFAKFLRASILKNICERLLLTMLAHSPQSSQCCPNMAETTLHKKITGAMLAQTTYRSSHRRCSVKRCVLKNFAIFTGKHLC